MTADPKFFLFFFIQVIYIFTTTSLHPREVNAEHLQTMEENSVSFVYWEPKKSDYFSWKKKERKRGERQLCRWSSCFWGEISPESGIIWSGNGHGLVYAIMFLYTFVVYFVIRLTKEKVYEHINTIGGWNRNTHTQKNKQIEKTFVFSWSPALLQILSINIRRVTSA